VTASRIVRVRVLGRVQGVWYRAWTRGEAVRRGLSGWVRNRSDGSVEALFAGPAPEVREMIEACREGPPAARVDRIEVEEGGAQPSGGFQQLPTV
jgi:acylphosphatase